MNSIIFTLALLVIVGLAGYAYYLAVKLHKAKIELLEAQQQAEQKLKDHQQKLINDIQFIARSVLSEQCEITEGVMRLNYLITALDADVWQDSALMTVRQHHGATADMPILEAYKSLSKKQQFELDNQRYKLEESHKTAILKEMQWLASYRFPSITLLH